ncbi:hypothetical protein [Synechococcus phage S-8S53]|nr:hypothetical protein [Synechococcus phage S-8S53]WLW37642.1 hypothetical protein [Synechococcus phage S-8S53]
MSIGDVPDAPLATVEVFVSQTTAQLTLTLLLLKDLQRDLREHGVGGVDAVGIELGLFHVAIVGPSGERGTLFSPVRESAIGDRLRCYSAHHQKRQLVAALDLVG